MVDDCIMDDYEYLRSVVDAQALLQRWRGVLPSELGELVNSGKLPAYWVIKKVWDDSVEEGEAEPRLTFVCILLGKIPDKSGEYDFDRVVFRFAEVALLEHKHPEYTLKIERTEYDSNNIANKFGAGKCQWVDCDTLASRWGWSPFDVVTLLSSGAIPFINYWNHEPYVEGLHEFSVHQADLLRWETANADKISNPPVLAKDGERLREENKALAAKVAELEILYTENVDLRFELAAERAKPRADPLKPPKTAAASKAASDLKAEEWKRHAGHMVKIAVQCGVEGPKPRKRPQLQVIAKRHGGELPKTALQVLWEALPDDHISREPGPQRQG